MFDVRRSLLALLYVAALFFSVPLSLSVWYVRRELIKETSVAGDDSLGGLSKKDTTEPFSIKIVERVDH